MSSGPELIILVSSHEATGSNYPPPERDASTSYGSPPSPLAFHQASLTNFCYPFMLLGGERHCERKVYCTRTEDIDPARLKLQTPWPWVHLTNHKATMFPQEGRFNAEFFLIGNKFYKPKVKFSYLIYLIS